MAENLPKKINVFTEKIYKNPVLDTNFADPTLIRAADGFYYGYATNTDRAGKQIHIQVRRSIDLIHWEDMGDALPEKPSWASKDFWAPHVEYDKVKKRYFLYYSGESTGEEEGKCLGVATSTSPAEPFKDIG